MLELIDVRKTFNDFQQESAISLNKVIIQQGHPWIGQYIKDIHFNGKALILMITRDNKKIVPKGITQILENDEILIGSTHTESDIDINLCETFIDEKHEWLNLEIKEIDLPETYLIALIKRGEEYFVPNGSTKIKLKDTIVFYNI
jgi:cell volume regulation protein A